MYLVTLAFAVIHLVLPSLTYICLILFFKINFALQNTQSSQDNLKDLSASLLDLFVNSPSFTGFTKMSEFWSVSRFDNLTFSYLIGMGQICNYHINGMWHFCDAFYRWNIHFAVSFLVRWQKDKILGCHFRRVTLNGNNFDLISFSW